MNHAFLSGLRILALDPASRGLGYVVIEGPDVLIEWGFRNARGNKDVQRIVFVGALLARYKPDVLVLEEYVGRQRSARIQHLANAFAKLALDRGTQVHRIPRKAVRSAMLSKSKYDIADKLAARFPELKRYCPPHRKLWKAEDSRINIFDALALAWASIAVWTREDESLAG
jgi:Holliday junction resolvasome RuvABC endonuclease subunit